MVHGHICRFQVLYMAVPIHVHSQHDVGVSTTFPVRNQCKMIVVHTKILPTRKRTWRRLAQLFKCWILCKAVIRCVWNNYFFIITIRYCILFLKSEMLDCIEIANGDMAKLCPLLIVKTRIFAKCVSVHLDGRTDVRMDCFRHSIGRTCLAIQPKITQSYIQDTVLWIIRINIPWIRPMLKLSGKHTRSG